ncbi:MAG: pyridoxamine 5'-phosphate oxidase family protein [Ilumatobacteraceae bacterium]
MSIAVDLDELPGRIAGFRWAYLLTVRDDQRSHVVAVTPTWQGGSLVISVGRGSAANAASRPMITLCYPPIEQTGFSLVIDGEATVDDDTVTVRPTAAVLHRPAPPAG